MNNEKLKELMSNEEFIKKIILLDTEEEVKAAFKEQGIDMTSQDIDDLGNFLAALESKAETLSPEELEDITGGTFEDGGFKGGFIDGFKDAGDDGSIEVVKNLINDLTDGFDKDAGSYYNAGYYIRGLAITAAIIGGLVTGGISLGKWIAKRKSKN